jgi:hypothetical protein
MEPLDRKSPINPDQTLREKHNNNNRLITLSGCYKNLHYSTQFIDTIFYTYKNKIYLKNYVLLPVVYLHLVVPE